MNLQKRHFFCFYFILSSLLQTVLGQDLIPNTKVSGVVKDAETGEVLPFVDVFFVGTDIGSTSDINGYFVLTTKEPVDSIGFSYLGYQRKHLRITTNTTQEINVQLSESSLNLVTATVTAKRGKSKKDTAAIALWRNVVANRSTNSIDNATSYQYKDYIQTGFDWYNPDPNIVKLKFLQKPFSVINDYIRTEDTGEPFLPVLMKETIKEVKYQKEPKDKKVKIIADRFSGIDNESLSDFIGNELDEIDPYKDMIILTGKSFVSPFAATANINYNFFITDSVERNGDQYYLLTFVGKRQQDYTFLGGAWIHKPTSAIESIDLEISPYIALNFIQKLNAVQYYTPTEQGVWVKTTENLTATVAIDFFDFGRKKAKKRKNQMRIRKKLSRHEVAINPVFEADAFQVEDVQFAEQSAELSDETWDSIRPIPLDSMSLGVYEMIDSIQRTRFYKTMDAIVYTMITSYIKVGPIEFGEYPEFVSWNEIEGVRFKMGLRTTKSLSDKIQVHGYAAYGLRDKEWKYGSGFNVHLPSKNRKWNMLSANYQYDFQMMGQRKISMQHDNIMNSLSRATPMDRLMKIREAELSYERDWFMGFYSKIDYRWRRFYSTQGGFQFTQNNGEFPVASFTTSEFKVKLHWGHQERFWTDNAGFRREPLGTPFPILELEYTAGVEGIFESDYNYHKLDFSIKQRLSSLIGYTKYQLQASKIFGEAPYPVMTVHLGNESIMGNRFAYAMMNEFEFVSDAYASIWITHHFDGWIFNSIPLIKKLKLRSIFIFKGLYGVMSSDNNNPYDIPQGISAPNYYAEIGFGIENILKILRVDFMWRLTQLDAPEVRPFGVNISIVPKF
ncbi:MULTISPECIES: DUF5686 and carboxypeptidase-like regulatory domain-containing protein [unclassified Aureispira]|uniref:DUF5686 and carboxypeptidase-like regulatory domain-containing protein n=1 Tax=unclassified Aureispira TaxID=2649989 RepID=UPI0009DED8B4|nr:MULTISPECIES: DUF5686 and carboxypeptidase-like regulatory domain-containing protein [unclassified Aureispira]WMX16765.1 DUF5686 family protein [Aureispira sp. CCB-E]